MEMSFYSKKILTVIASETKQSSKFSDCCITLKFTKPIDTCLVLYARYTIVNCELYF